MDYANRKLRQGTKGLIGVPYVGEKISHISYVVHVTVVMGENFMNTRLFCAETACLGKLMLVMMTGVAVGCG